MDKGLTASMNQGKLLLTPAEAANTLGICRAMLYKLMARNEIPGKIRLGRSVRFSRKALEEWVDQQVNIERRS